MTIPVICDRCRTAGTAGSGDFSHFGDLLEFEPVPVQPRVNGWDAEAQRAFIALLATTGSKRRAALAIGRNAHGIDQLLKRPDSAAFKAAYDRALAIAKANGAIKLATGVADAAARNAAMTPSSRLRGHEPEEEAEEDEEAQFALLDNIFRKFLHKVAAEREARLAGQVVAADFYLRQVTFVEIALDLIAEGLGLGAWQALADQRRGGHTIFDIAETPMSRLLDAKRREQWAQMADPERPDHPPRRYLVDQSARRSNGDGEPVRETIRLEPLQCLGKASPPPPGIDREAWRAMEVEEQRLMLDAHYESEAEIQIAHEASAQLARGASEHEASALKPSPLVEEVGRSRLQGSIGA